MANFTIEKNIPVPPSRSRGSLYPFKELAQGESFLVTFDPEKARKGIQSLRSYVARNTANLKPKRFICRSVDANSIRVWRTE